MVLFFKCKYRENRFIISWTDSKVLFSRLRSTLCRKLLIESIHIRLLLWDYSIITSPWPWEMAGFGYYVIQHDDKTNESFLMSVYGILSVQELLTYLYIVSYCVKINFFDTLHIRSPRYKVVPKGPRGERLLHVKWNVWILFL